MAERFKKLRAAGDWGGHLADLLTLLTANWALVVSAVIAIAGGSLGWVRVIALTPAVYVGVGIFLVLLWTIVGAFALIDRRRPRVTKAFADYAYGLTFEGIAPNFIGTNNPLPSQQGALQFTIHVRNFSPGPIRYSLEFADIRVGTRSIPKLKPHTVTGYMARGSGRAARPEGFPAGSLSEFYGKGETKGTVDFAFVYGPPDGAPVRRLTVSAEITLIFPASGAINPVTGDLLGYADSLLSEEDRAIS